MNQLAHITMVRSHPVHEIREVTVPISETRSRVLFFQKFWETVFVDRISTSKDFL